MNKLKACVLTNKKTEIGLSRHHTIAPFMSLIDACGFDLITGPINTCLDELSFYELIFVDAYKANDPSFFQQPIFTSPDKDRIVLFGLSSEQKNIESIALLKGLRGVFFEHDALDNIVKGIQKIKKGQYWFTRDTMELALRQLLEELPYQEPIQQSQYKQTHSLTKRERMIVSLICQGAKNKEVAEQLHISINTVKTHVYSIYRKTKSRNRVELINCSFLAGVLESS
ncbi:MAG: DNA-binding NarL/FixJ family response regulator [Paraglaciecola sp.]|jgi:DNA-binding NarL/FixJ family response regulator